MVASQKVWRAKDSPGQGPIMGCSISCTAQWGFWSSRGFILCPSAVPLMSSLCVTLHASTTSLDRLQFSIWGYKHTPCMLWSSIPFHLFSTCESHCMEIQKTPLPWFRHASPPPKFTKILLSWGIWFFKRAKVPNKTICKLDAVERDAFYAAHIKRISREAGKWGVDLAGTTEKVVGRWWPTLSANVHSCCCNCHCRFLHQAATTNTCSPSPTGDVQTTNTQWRETSCWSLEAVENALHWSVWHKCISH